MARRYIVQPRTWFPDGEWNHTYICSADSISVIERETAPQPTGLLDAQGNRLFAVDERDPIGFVRFR